MSTEERKAFESSSKSSSKFTGSAEVDHVPKNVSNVNLRRLYTFLLACLLLLGIGYFAFQQDPWIDPLTPPERFSANWFTHPIEINAHRRVHQVKGDFNAVAIADDGKQAIAVGNGGLIVASDDGGETWRQVKPKLEKEAEGAPAQDTSQEQAQQQQITVPTIDELRQQLALLGNSVEFDVERIEISETAFSRLQAWSGFLRANSNVRISLDIPIPADLKVDLDLVNSRLSVIRQALIDQGVSADRIDTDILNVDRLFPEDEGPDFGRRVELNLVSLEDDAAAGRLGARDTTSGGGEPQAIDYKRIDYTAVHIRPDGKILIGGANQTIFSIDQKIEGPWILGDVDGPNGAVITSFSTVADSRRLTSVASMDRGPSPLVQSSALSQWQEVLAEDFAFDELRLFERFGVARVILIPANKEDSIPGILLLTTDKRILDLRRPREFFPALIEAPAANDIAFNQQGTGFVIVRDQGLVTILEPNNSDVKVTEVKTNSSSNLTRITGQIGGPLWAVGTDGTVMQSNDRGETWRDNKVSHAGNLQDIAFASDNLTGLAVGTGGTIIRSTDGGKSWGIVAVGPTVQSNPFDGLAQTVSYTRYPSPVSILSIFVLVLVVGLIYWRFPFSQQRPEEDNNESEVVKQQISEYYNSDAPVTAPDRDRLGVNTLAKALAGFLLNENTAPPLTLAISGKWGQGKSSLMGLICNHTERYKMEGEEVRHRTSYRPVWFNAWHHQNETHLLAALLETIRSEAIAPWWRWVGIRFRGCLFWTRIKRQPWTIALLLLLTMVPAGFAVGLPDGTYQKAIIPVIDFLDPNKNSDSKDAKQDVFSEVIEGELTTKSGVLTIKRDTTRTHKDGNKANGESENGIEKIIKGLLTLISFLAAFGVFASQTRTRFGAFGLDPGKLVRPLSGRIRSSELRAMVSFRHNFSQEFRDVTDALAPGRIVLVIDDLDRCQPEHVVEILEAINFLVSSGDCFVILGMDMKWIEGCIVLAYADMAEVLKPQDVSENIPGGDEDQEPTDEGSVQVNTTKKEKLRSFAQLYLQKLVNIEVPVPSASLASSLSLASNIPSDEVSQNEAAKDRDLEKKVARQRFIVALVAWVFFATALAYGGWLYGNAFPDPNELKVTIVTEQTVLKTTEAEKPTDEGKIGEPPTPTPVTDQPSELGELIVMAEAEFVNYTLPIALMFAAGVLGFIYYWTGRIREEDVFPSDTQEFTEFMNIWAPIIYAKDFNPRSVKRFVNRVRYLAMRRKIDMERGVKVSEEVLVAAAAIHHCSGGELNVVEWSEDDRFLSQIYSSDTLDKLSPKDRDKLLDNIQKHAKEMRHSLPDAFQCEIFKEWVRDIRVN